jgi:hypothetical protein
VKLLVQCISAGKRADGRTEIKITYRFGPPAAEDAYPDEELSVVPFKNGSLSYFTNLSKSG